MEKLEKIAISECAVSRCKGGRKALIVAAKGDDVKSFPGCKDHYNGIHMAVVAKFADYGYIVACYKELLRK